MKKNIKCIASITIFVITLAYFTPCFATTEDSIYVWASTSNTIETSNNTANCVNSDNTATSQNTPNFSNANLVSTPTSSEETESNSLNLESQSAILIEQSTGQILYSHNIHEQLRPASVTKVMSILLIMEALDSGKISLTDSVPCSENASSMGGSQIWLDPRETLSVDEMLKAICVASANDYKVQLRHKKF